MKKQKYYINLTDQERSEILSSLLIKKNKLTHQGKFTDGIDEVICKLMKARTKLCRDCQDLRRSYCKRSRTAYRVCQKARYSYYGNHRRGLYS